jgi:hypothetical protein
MMLLSLHSLTHTGCCDYHDDSSSISCYRCFEVVTTPYHQYCKTLISVKTDAINNKDTFKPSPYLFIG